MDDWKRGAKSLQQYFCDGLGDRKWDLFRSHERWALESKIAMALFGGVERLKYAIHVCSEVQVSSYYENILNTVYSVEQRGLIRRVCNKIYKTARSSKHEEVLVAFLFVVGICGNDSYIQPVFRVYRYGENRFIDSLCRVYENWWDFKANNKLPAGKACYPDFGIYTTDMYGHVCIHYDDTPANSKESRELADMDQFAGKLSVVTTGIAVASLFIPIVGPFASFATWVGSGLGVYGFARAASTLHDRRTHHQCITNSESLGCWLSLAGGAFSVGGSLATKGMASAVAKGEIVSPFTQKMVNFLNYGALAVNGFGIASTLPVLAEKADNNELTARDVIQFSVSLLFFGNCAMNIKTANTIIEQIQKDKISNFTTDMSKRRENAYKKLVRKSGGDGTMEDRARIIKGITNVESKDEFFRMAIRGQKQSSSTALNDEGRLVVDGKAYVDTDAELQTHVRLKPSSSSFAPSAYSYSSFSTRQIVTDHTVQGLVQLIEFACIEHKKEFINLMDGVQIAVKKFFNYLAHLFERFFTSKEKNTFPPEKVITFIENSEKFALSQECRTESDFMDFSKFMCIYIKNKAEQMEKNYLKMKDDAKKLLGEKFNEVQFAREHGIENVNERETTFLAIINDEIKESNEELRKKFETMEKDITAVNEDGGLAFKSNHIAMNFYFESYVMDGEEISVSEFFSIIREAVEGKRSIVTPDSKATITHHKNEVVSVYVDECNERKILLSVKFLE